jgi:hypothetical protein
MKPTNHKIKYAVLLMVVAMFGCSKDKNEIPQTLHYCKCESPTGIVIYNATDSTYEYAVQLCDSYSTNYSCRILDKSETKNLYACFCPELAPSFRILGIIEGKDSATKFCNQAKSSFQNSLPNLNCYLAR